ncbi:MAG: HEAT repeat domain-containing protein [Vicinamibacterales bacterium]
MKPFVTAWLVALLTNTATPCAAQPRLERAQVTGRSLTGSLEATVRSIAVQTVEPAWIAWETPAVPARGSDDWCWHDGVMVQSNRLEPADTLFVFLRVANRRLERVRMFNDGCPIDAGNRPVTWLRNVEPADSLTLLTRLAADRTAGTRVSKGALAALAQHAGPAAAQPLLRLARQSPDAKLRGDALFWLAQRAGREAADAITGAIANDPETAVKKRAVFALSQLPPGEGIPKLIDVARTHRNPAVRKQAMFWLGQSKDPRALAFFEEVLK